MTDKTLYTLRYFVEIKKIDEDYFEADLVSLNDRSASFTFFDRQQVADQFVEVDVVKQKTAIRDIIKSAVSFGYGSDEIAVTGAPKEINAFTETVWRVLYPNTEQDSE